MLSKGWSVLGKLQQSSRTDDFVRAPRHLWGTVLLQLARVASTRVVPGISSVRRGQLPAQPGSSHHSGSATDKVFILTGRFMPCVLLFPIWQRAGRQARSAICHFAWDAEKRGCITGRPGFRPGGLLESRPAGSLTFVPLSESSLWHYAQTMTDRHCHGQ